jgi:hypothetical protein
MTWTPPPGDSTPPGSPLPPPPAYPPPGYSPGGYPPPEFAPPGFGPGGFPPGGEPAKNNTPLIVGIVVGVVVVLALCGGLGVAGFLALRGSDSPTGSGSNVDAAIDGVVDYRASAPATLTRQHVTGEFTYSVSPPVGGDHDATWQNCQGDVYTAAIGNTHAVHSLEHGAVWITYRPDLPAAQIQQLAAKVKGTDYTFLSPFPGLDKPVSLQAWGYQLKVDNADDGRVDRFLEKYRVTASMEPGATCGNGTTATG